MTRKAVKRGGLTSGVPERGAGSARVEENTDKMHGGRARGRVAKQAAAQKALAPNSRKDGVPEESGHAETEKLLPAAKRARVEENAAGQSSSPSRASEPNATQLQPDVQERCKVLLEVAQDLVKQLQPLKFKAPVTHVYNPLEYAMKSYMQYVTRYGGRSGIVLLVGLNPGPWGMAQTGVPFGDTSMVKDFLGIMAPVEQPPKVHPKRLVYGFSCPYKEVSGQRIWGWARDRYKDPEAFFNKFYVMNYCPLAFMEGPNGKLRTPDKLPAAERDAVVRICDEALTKTIEVLKPKLVIGIGQYTSERVRRCAGDIKTGTVMHPSPANPATNAGWAGIAEKQLQDMGVDLS
ncbi:single-strand selective monofunctional uracil DNA glycosylase [Klebsormidium nitens]|uniref:Single-strand selective monofunctional uracil DNA glycosylase n=1 Tax=Klebsormidium nitens TaxID=105231 RepID=A0A1Y1HNH1_KLENI|nr:single-strand selective monofunctional uracil DNA glycosylase [Klebsormidium nitens]|eukprot:GAQ80190.1 single-strand selective monofunctional uracil DNA glycosylase [Klebsormidium nitens]